MIPKFIKQYKMKFISKISTLIVILFTIVIFPSCGGNEQPSENDLSTEITAENLLEVDYAVDGMVCAMGCAATIQKEVNGMDGVKNCEVSFEEGKAHIEFDKSVLSENDIISKIESIADGQYKVSTWVEKDNTENSESKEGNGGNGKKESSAEVSLPSFEIPNLFTLIIDQI